MSGQFGDLAKRVTNEEMQAVHAELNQKIGGLFCAFDLVRTLEEKQDHGDIDILVLTHPDQNPRKVIDALEPEKYVRNGHCHSVLYKTNAGDRVHVDFLVSGDPNLHMTKTQYYAFNYLSAVVGLMAKKLNFKYGTEGFFKRYKDKRGNWHDVLISVNLNPGLQILGLDPKPLWIKTSQDIINYVSSSLLFDSDMFAPKPDDLNEEVGVLPGNIEEKMENGGRHYLICRELGKLGKKAALTDEDYFFRRLFSTQYAEVQDKIKEIENKAYQESRFNGYWLISNFGVKPGPQIGKLLKAISDHFGDRLGDAPEEEVVAFVRSVI